MASVSQNLSTPVNEDPDLERLREARELAAIVWGAAGELTGPLEDIVRRIAEAADSVDDSTAKRAHEIALAFSRQVARFQEIALETERNATEELQALDRQVVAEGGLSFFDASDHEDHEAVIEQLDREVDFRHPDVCTELLPGGWLLVAVPKSWLYQWFDGTSRSETSSASCRVYLSAHHPPAERRQRALGCLEDIAANSGDEILLDAVRGALVEALQ